MEILEDFSAAVSSGTDGYGDYGSGDGAGYGGYSAGYGGFGSGYGRGDGSGYGGGCGFGYGYGGGCGYNGYGRGYGTGGYGIARFNGSVVSIIDGVATLVGRIYKGVAAKGRTLNGDLTTTPCWVVKDNNLSAHGATLKDAYKALQAKILDGMDIDEKIAEFKKHFATDKAYSVKDFYEWHHILTGSCEMGRTQFAKDHSIDLNGEMTVSEFIALTENAYGGEVIRRLKEQK